MRFLLSLLMFPAITFASHKELKIDLGHGSSSVEFHATGTPSLVNIHGKAEKGLDGVLKINGDDLSGECKFSLGEFDTGISMRDSHMKEKYLEIGKYPAAKLLLRDVKLIKGGGEFPFEGVLSMHGTQKKVVGRMLMHKHGGEVETTASFKVHMSDFNIKVPAFAGISVKDEVSIDVHANSPAAIIP